MITVALAKMFSDEYIRWELVFAGSFVATVPVVVIFVFLQRYYVQGFVRSGTEIDRLVIMNIIVVVSDTFRRDHLPCYADTDVITPNLNRFAETALIFEDCYAGSFPTVPARADLMTGRYTFTYLPWAPLPQSELTLADVISSAGYNTAAIADTPFLARRGYGQERGFKEFVYIRGQLHGTERDYRQLAAATYQRSTAIARRRLLRKPPTGWSATTRIAFLSLCRHLGSPRALGPTGILREATPMPEYGGEVIAPTYYDYAEDGVTASATWRSPAPATKAKSPWLIIWFGYLIERVRVLNLLENTAIFFLSDHGFYFGEHGLFGKRRFRWPDGSGFDEGFRQGLDRSPTTGSPIAPAQRGDSGAAARLCAGRIDPPRLRLAFLTRSDANNAGSAGLARPGQRSSEICYAAGGGREDPRPGRNERSL